MISAVTTLIFLVSCVNGHAMLSYPTAWVQNPTKTAPCGGLSTYPAANQIAQLTIGNQLNVGWNVIAADGSGTVTAQYSLDGSTTFTNSWNGFSISAPQVGSFQGVAIVPNVTCNPTCTAQLSNPAGWVSCFSFVTGNFSGITNAPVPKQCTPVQNLGFCTMLNGKSVLSAQGENIAQRDTGLSTYYKSLINNTAVFTNALTTQNSDCLQRLPYVLCQGSYSYCGASIVYKTADQCYCQDTMTSCGLTTLHQNLFNCSQYPACASTPTPSGSSQILDGSWIMIMLGSMISFML